MAKQVKKQSKQVSKYWAPVPKRPTERKDGKLRPWTVKSGSK